MPLIDRIEHLGRAVESEDMTRIAAITELLLVSPGGLTEAGAADLIDNWATARANYERVLT